MHKFIISLPEVEAHILKHLIPAEVNNHLSQPGSQSKDKTILNVLKLSAEICYNSSRINLFAQSFVILKTSSFRSLLQAWLRDPYLSHESKDDLFLVKMALVPDFHTNIAWSEAPRCLSPVTPRGWLPNELDL